MKIENLTEQDVNIIIQSLSNVQVQVKDAHIILDLIQKIKEQTDSNVK